MLKVWLFVSLQVAVFRHACCLISILGCQQLIRYLLLRGSLLAFMSYANTLAYLLC